MNTMWKLRHKPTGLYAKIRHSDNPKGNCSKDGKIWRTLPHLRAHIRNNIEYYEKFLDEYEIVCFSFIESGVETISSSVDFIKNRQEDKAKEREEAWKRYQIKSLEDQLKKLKGE